MRQREGVGGRGAGDRTDSAPRDAPLRDAPLGPIRVPLVGSDFGPLSSILPVVLECVLLIQNVFS